MENYQLTAKTFYGLEEVLANEIKNIGAENIQILNRAVSFTGDKEILYRANLQLRTALRIFKNINSFSLRNENQLYSNIKKIDWTEIINIKQSFAVNSTVNSKYFNHSQYVALKTKDAIADQFVEKIGLRPSVDKERPDVLINIHISHTTCNVSIDTSGRPLNQRGYRDRTVDAPINEVLAAGLILLSGWDKKSNFVDIMYGSGTILIEAAMIARNIAPSKNREYFAFKHWNDFDSDLFFEILDDLKSKEIKFDYEIVGCDVSRRAFTIAKENVNYANLKNTIMVVKKDFEKFEPPEGGGILITNPPYNERMQIDDAIEFIKKIGDKFKHDFKGYKCYVFSGDLSALKHLGLKASSKTKLYNGPIECRLNKYDIY